MSSFCDIIIEGQVGYRPTVTRGGNKSWEHKGGYWSSLPEGVDHFPYFNTIGDEQYELIVLGQFYEEVDNRALLSAAIDYSTGAVNKYNDPAGHYILFLLDKRTHHVHVFTNRFGTYHAYLYKQGREACIGTFYLGLAKQASKKDLDWEGINGFLNMGYFPNDATYLKSIKILEPASYYHFDGSMQKLEQKRYWNWSEQEQSRSVEEYLYDFDKALSNSLDTAVKGKKVALPISGGLDSRTIAGQLTKESVTYSDLWGYSYGFAKGPKETEVARKIAEARGIPFHYYAVPQYLFDNIDLIAESVDLFQYIDGTRQASTVGMLQERSDMVIGGHWGDVWFDKMGIDTEDQLQPYFRKIVKRGSQWFRDNLCNEYVSDSDGMLNDYFKTAIAKYDHLSSPDLKMKAYKTDQWSFRWTLASIRMYQAGAMPVLPFYDKHVADTLINVPTELLQGRELQIEYIKKYHKDLAKIVWQEYDANLYNYKLFNNRNLIYRAVAKAKRTLSPGKFISRNWELFYLNENGRKQLEKILLDNPKLTDIVSKEKIKGIIEDLYRDPSAANGYTISMLHTFAQFVRIVL